MGSKRKEKVTKLADLLYHHVVEPQRERIKATGTLPPTKSLRHKATRECLKWAAELEGRWFTLTMVRDSLKLATMKHQVEVPEVPGLSMVTWIDSEAARLQKLLRRARKCSPDLPDSEAEQSEHEQPQREPQHGMDPDNCDTLPWPLDPGEDLCVSGFHVWEYHMSSYIGL